MMKAHRHEKEKENIETIFSGFPNVSSISGKIENE
jgi:hypothetical protein